MSITPLISVCHGNCFSFGLEKEHLSRCLSVDHSSKNVRKFLGEMEYFTTTLIRSVPVGRRVIFRSFLLHSDKL
jgi:hypothetical protein